MILYYDAYGVGSFLSSRSNRVVVSNTRANAWCRRGFRNIKESIERVMVEDTARTSAAELSSKNLLRKKIVLLYYLLFLLLLFYLKLGG
jgi:hypothetical protein